MKEQAVTGPGPTLSSKSQVQVGKKKSFKDISKFVNKAKGIFGGRFARIQHTEVPIIIIEEASLHTSDSSNLALPTLKTPVPTPSTTKPSEDLSNVPNTMSSDHPPIPDSPDVEDLVPSRSVSEYSNSENDDEMDRRDWETIRAIPELAIRQLVFDIVNGLHKDKLDFEGCQILGHAEGSFHYAVMLWVYIDAGHQEKYVLKVPLHGTPGRWRDEDADMLHSEANLLNYIRRNTNVPVPEVIMFDNRVWNEINAPYILMKKLPGKAAHWIWFNNSYDNLEGKEYLDADYPSNETVKKREHFLRSLAQTMSELHTLEFDKIGLPVFDYRQSEHPVEISKSWFWHSPTKKKELTSIGPFNSTEEFFMSGLEKAWNPDKKMKHLRPYGCVIDNGVRKILEIIFNTPAFKSSKKSTDTAETFVLRHDDLDLQNILTDDDGNVTGIIDLDGCMAVPRCVGYASIPVFLRRHWLPDFDMKRIPHLSWAQEYYSQVYAEAMKATGVEDAKYTNKSPIYQLALAILYESALPEDLVNKVLMELPTMRHIDLDDFQYRLGLGWPAAEKYLEGAITELLDPERGAVSV
ncbi:hypothetical protein K505DRAFT_238448 [Melanomma pulvis-pyrius CBS 109.77]|uniref:Aminoglycoside phosphotransferase domain-containing protein n=1 Tax=Melanomma pulvis-pyrius CBS 109.77 TaxID=1314802 RepID=A0A6A6XI87_9PLEO|nr:hypothetical protein K505DRAFT_238448 [Melanomma pulvis-pyrius CBS 109.77]